MAKYSGSALYAEFAGQDISGEYRSLTVNDGVNLINVEAGSDQYEEVIKGIRKIESSMSIMWEDDTQGSAVQAALEPGAYGTLTFAPLGTASGQPKYSFACYVQDANPSMPYQDALTLDITFKANGGWLENWAYLGDTY